MNKKKIYTGGLVYSTHQHVVQEEIEDENDTLANALQTLKVKLDSKQRAGKVVTMIEGFIGKQADLESLGKILKTKCGTGGTAKDGVILVQGDYLTKITQLLQQMNYKVKRK